MLQQHGDLQRDRYIDGCHKYKYSFIDIGGLMLTSLFTCHANLRREGVVLNTK